MRSKQKAAVQRKRAALPRKSDFTQQFAKDWKRLSDSGLQDLTRLKETMALLVANEGPLAEEWHDHPLNGKWRDHRELHAKGDLLLIYKIAQDMVVFVRAGTHAELF